MNLVEVIEFYRADGNPVANFDLAPDVLPPDWDEICAKYGLERGGTVLKVARDNSPVEPMETSLRIEPVDQAGLKAWAELQVELFQLPDPDGLLAGLLASRGSRPMEPGTATSWSRWPVCTSTTRWASWSARRRVRSIAAAARSPR